VIIADILARKITNMEGFGPPLLARSAEINGSNGEYQDRNF